jgi:hypothetical protein
MAENIVVQINDEINLLAVFIGLVISIFILFLGASSFGGVASTGMANVLNYIFMVLMAMIFFGSIVSGFLGSTKLTNGLINGAFLNLVIMVLTGIVMGIFLFLLVGIEASINNALNSLVSSSGLNTFVTAPTINLSSAIFGNQFGWLQLILVGILMFMAGIIGGGAGFYLKQIIKQIF